MILISVILTLALFAPFLPACKPALAATAYTAIIPAILQAGSKQKVSVALFAEEAPASGNVNLVLLKDGKEFTRAQSNIKGNGEIQLTIPDGLEGDYTLRVQGDKFQDEARVAVTNNYLIFLETDKPIYKPGQTIHMRAITVDPELNPASENVTVDVLDAKGIKIFRKSVQTDAYGMALVDLPISTEPNLGTWKITAETPKSKAQIDIKIEEYVLPKYEVKVDLPKEWFLVSDQIKGKVTATYSFGKPVKGDLEIKATKYVGTWQDYAISSLTSMVQPISLFRPPVTWQGFRQRRATEM
jgi:CD109 antigen